MACWQSSPEIRKFMTLHNYTKLAQVQQHYVKRHVAMVKELGLNPISWQDPLDFGVKVNN